MGFLVFRKYLTSQSVLQLLSVSSLTIKVYPIFRVRWVEINQ
jgi:hypothetical protein